MIQWNFLHTLVKLKFHLSDYKPMVPTKVLNLFPIMPVC